MSPAEGIHPLRPEEGSRDTGERDGGGNGNGVSNGEECAEVESPGELEDAAVEEEDGQFDHWDGGCVEDDIGEDDLSC